MLALADAAHLLIDLRDRELLGVALAYLALVLAHPLLLLGDQLLLGVEQGEHLARDGHLASAVGVFRELLGHLHVEVLRAEARGRRWSLSILTARVLLLLSRGVLRTSIAALGFVDLIRVWRRRPLPLEQLSVLAR